MYSIDNYIKHTIMLTNSLVIKSLGTALAMNKGIVRKYGVGISLDKKEWKYYLNISGQKHTTNNDVKVYVIETTKKESLSKTLLDTYSTTKKELRNGGSYYQDLINEYPDDRLFIHGCLYPVDIDTAIAAKDGDILAYNEDYVESAESNLMNELQDFVTNFFHRWYIREYTLVDELYMAAFLGNLYLAIPHKIMNIRLSKILTPEVHSFHMEHFFRSNLDIWDSVQILSPASRMWLYNNLRYLRNNIGKNSTFNTIIEKIFSANSVGLGSYIIRTNDVEPNYNGRNIDIKDIPVNESIYTRSANMLSGIKLNEYYEADNNKTMDTDTILNLEINALKIDKLNSEPTKRDKFVISNAKEAIDTALADKQETKIIELSSSKLFKMYGSDIYKIILDHWVYFVQNGLVEYSIEYVDPNTNKIYILTPRAALLVMLKYLIVITKNPNLKLTALNYNYVLNPDSSIVYTILSKLREDGLTDKAVAMLINSYPNAGKYIPNVNETCNYIKSSVDFYTKCWFMDANSSSIPVSANIKHILQLATIYGQYQLTDVEGGETIDELLLKEGLYIEIPDEYDIIDSIEELFKSAVLIDVEASADMDNNIELYIDLLNKLTSYTVQAINSKTEEEKIFVYYNNTDIYRTYKGVVQVEDGYLVPYDRSYIHIKAYSNTFVDGLTSEIVDDDQPIISVGEWPINGWMININTWYNHITDPILLIEIHDFPVVDVSDLEFYNDYITAATSRLIPYDQGYVPVDTLHTNIEDNPTEAWAGVGQDTTLDNKYIALDNTISGYGFVMDSNGTNDNMLVIEIEETL